MSRDTSRYDRGVRRVLTAFEKDPEDALIEEWPLENISVAELQALFHRPSEDPIHTVHVVGPRRAKVIQKHIDHEMDLETLDYFLEAYREPSGPLKVLPTEISSSTSQVKPRTSVERLLEGEVRDNR